MNQTVKDLLEGLLGVTSAAVVIAAVGSTPGKSDVSPQGATVFLHISEPQRFGFVLWIFDHTE